MSDPDDRWLEILLEVHRGLPRQGPGLDASTRAALALCADLPPAPQILDLGCGPGMQTLALAEALPAARITAVDLVGGFLDELRERAQARGLDARIATVQGDMADLPFADASFDLLWSEGAAYSMGFFAALASWRRLLVDGGILAVSELVWLDRDPPAEAARFFAREYPAMLHADEVAARFAAHGYRLLGRFTLPDDAWWTPYYTPLAARLPELRVRFAADPQALQVVEQTAAEIEIRRRFHASYGYGFFVARRV